MALCTLTDLIVSAACLITSADIVLERENLPRKGEVPEDNGYRKECNDVGEAIVGPSTMNLDQSPPRHIPTTGVTAMMIP